MPREVSHDTGGAVALGIDAFIRVIDHEYDVADDEIFVGGGVI